MKKINKQKHSLISNKIRDILQQLNTSVFYTCYGNIPDKARDCFYHSPLIEVLDNTYYDTYDEVRDTINEKPTTLENKN